MKKFILRVIITIIVWELALRTTGVVARFDSMAYWTIGFLTSFAVGSFFNCNKGDETNQ